MTVGSDVRWFERAAAPNGEPGFRRILLARRSSKRRARAAGWPRAICYNPGFVDSDASLHDRVTIITGACRGIGHTTAVGFAMHGVQVMAAARTAGELNETVRPARAAGDESRYVTGQVIQIDWCEGGRNADPH
jgi:hypothetical protein